MSLRFCPAVLLSPLAPTRAKKRNSGGLETLFDSVKSHKVEIPSKKKEGLSDRTTVKGVINYIQKKMLKKNPEMFLKGENPSPSRTWEASNSDKSRTLVSLSHSSDPLLPSPELTSFFSTISRLLTFATPLQQTKNEGKELRPGILVLINDIDWELGGKEECIVENNDVVLFLSTLHGG